MVMFNAHTGEFWERDGEGVRWVGGNGLCAAFPPRNAQVPRFRLI